MPLHQHSAMVLSLPATALRSIVTVITKGIIDQIKVSAAIVIVITVSNYHCCFVAFFQITRSSKSKQRSYFNSEAKQTVVVVAMIAKGKCYYQYYSTVMLDCCYWYSDCFDSTA